MKNSNEYKHFEVIPKLGSKFMNVYEQTFALKYYLYKLTLATPVSFDILLYKLYRINFFGYSVMHKDAEKDLFLKRRADSRKASSALLKITD